MGAEADLLIDLARLLKKYGPEPFEALARSIGSPETSVRLAALLTGAAQAARATHQPATTAVRAPKTMRTAPLAAALETIKTSEPAKYSCLAELYENLKEGRVLPTMRAVRSFLAERGLPAISATSRDKAFPAVMRLLLPLSVEELKSLSKDLPRHDQHGRDLEGWSNLILDRNRRG